MKAHHLLRKFWWEVSLISQGWQKGIENFVTYPFHVYCQCMTLNDNRASWMSKLLNFQILKISNFPRAVFLFCNLLIDYATAVWFRQLWTVLQAAPSILSILLHASFYTYILSGNLPSKSATDFTLMRDLFTLFL